MAGDGVYNEHSTPQHVAGELGLDLLTGAAQAVPVDAADAVTLADYGSSQGRNSIAAMRAAISVLRERLAAARPIVVTHTDLPDNDFAALFRTLRDAPESYLRDAECVYAFAAGRSFYEQIFPADSVVIAWSSIAVHWLSRAPVPILRHIFSPLASEEQRRAYAAQAEEDWQRFLTHRGAELRRGGRLVVVGSGASPDGRSGAERLLDLANTVLLELVDEGILDKGDYERTVIPTYYRTREEFTRPLREEPLVGVLELESCSEAALRDPLWSEFQRTADRRDYATKVSDFLRAFSEPSLFGSVARLRSTDVAADIADRFYARVRDAIERQPEDAATAWHLVLMSMVRR